MNRRLMNEILYEGRERERREVASGWRWWLWMTALKLFIGYGYGLGNFLAVVWMGGLAFVSAVFLNVSGEARKNKLGWGVWYSVDHLLPGIQLRKHHYDVDLEGWARCWFFVHKLIGFILATFLVAGLAGLTK